MKHISVLLKPSIFCTMIEHIMIPDPKKNMREQVLSDINSEIRIHISTICTFPAFDAHSICRDIKVNIGKVESLLQMSSELTSRDFSLLSEMHMLAVVFQLMLKERIELGTGNSNNFSTLSSSKRCHRLTKPQLSILDNWYYANIKSPYAHSSQLKELSETTGLTMTQVANWLSNKRRREKSLHISAALEDILM